MTDADIAAAAASMRLVGIWDPHLSSFIPSSNDLFWSIIEKLSVAHATVSKAKLNDMQKHFGIKFEPNGLWFDTKLRELGVLRPVDNYIRGPMHSLTAGGAANTGTYLMLLVLMQWIKWDEFKAFAMQCVSEVSWEANRDLV